MASFSDARIWILNFGVLCSSACSGVAPDEGAGKPTADTYAASAQVEAKCAASHEQLIDLGTLDPDSTRFSKGLAVNDHGTVVGASTLGRNAHAFRWKADTGLVDLNPPGATGSSAVDINEQEQVIGYTYPPYYRAVLWDAENRVHELGTLGGEGSVVIAINNRGQVIGMAKDASGRSLPYIWDEQTGMQEIDLPSSDFVTLSGINDSGVVVGYWTSPVRVGAFKWTKEDGMTELDRLDDTWAIATDINNQGEIAGGIVENDEVIGVKWTASGVVRLPRIPGGVDTRPEAINDRGAMAGNDLKVGSFTAVKWDPTLRVSLLPLGANGSYASDLNDCGDITGIYVVACDVSHAFLWRPERSAQ